MNASLPAEVARIFRPRPGRGTGVGLEQELFAVGLMNGSSTDPERVRVAVAGSAYARWVSFEPGGQVELSLPPASGPVAAVAHLVDVTRALAADLIGHSIVLDAVPVRRCDPATPRYLRTPRYDAMERHLDTIGPAGRRMMRGTASTQVCLDWWSGAAGLEQWRLLQLAGPFLAAAFARSAGPAGRLTTWLDVDPGRTAFDDRLLGDDPEAAYLDFARSATVFLDPDDASGHLSTLFPPVRPRGSYLEVRFLDALPSSEVGEVAGALAGLLHDDQRRRTALRSLAAEGPRLGELWERAAAGDPELVERGRLLAAVPPARLADAA